MITGVGEINAAAAVSNIGGAYGISPDDEILNVGCGAEMCIRDRLWGVCK